MVMKTRTRRERARERERQTDRQTHRLRQAQTGTDRQTNTDRQTGRQTDSDLYLGTTGTLQQKRAWCACACRRSESFCPFRLWVASCPCLCPYSCPSCLCSCAWSRPTWTAWAPSPRSSTIATSSCSAVPTCTTRALKNDRWKLKEGAMEKESLQESFWGWQCSDRHIISLFPHLHSPLPSFSPSLISLVVSVDVKHDVYLEGEWTGLA